MSAPHLPPGREIRINSTTTGNQDHASVTVLADGSFVVIWESNGQDGSGAGVFGRHFAADGTAISGEFRVAETTDGNQSRAQVTALEDGGFAVVWQAGGTNPDDGGAAEPWDIYLRLLDADGTARGAERLVNTTTGGTQSWADIATREDGSLVVTWRDTFNGTVAFQVFDEAGAVQGGEHATWVGSIYNQSVLALEGGGHLLLWSGDWDPQFGIFGQIFAEDGSAISGRLHINNDFPNGMSGSQVAPAAVALPGGGFAVTWLTAYDGWPTGIQARIFDAAGTAVTHNFSVSQPALAGHPGIAALEDGSFVVVWTQPGTEGGDILARRYLADGTALGAARLVTANVAGDQQAPQVVAMPDGGYVVTWQQLDRDGDGWGVYSRVFPVETYGTSGDDRLVDLQATGWIDGVGGNDTILGLDGNDTLSGGAGDDTVAGGVGDDAIWLGTGNDTGRGEDGADRILGEDGADLLRGDTGNDSLLGGNGLDTLLGGEGDDWMDGGNEADSMNGGAGADGLFGRAGNDTLIATAGNDKLNGGAGEDRLEGGDGNDLIRGGAGADTLAGMAGNDTLRGGGGADSFVIDTSAGRDLVASFEDDVDSLWLDEALWGGGLTVAEVLEAHAIVTAGGVVLRFGGGTTEVAVHGITVADLADDIVLF